ncbi:MAG: carbon-nitrogen hydrolase family protein [Eubacteriaceae bacterium]|jgi:omega-amidase|nr:carbon-nitrogen hydrolase family protein [Eubacteriaceae bacterium]MDD4507461.1 carbon-nitrogen hydrolase family protein [Eubacteriaceae bacterium]
MKAIISCCQTIPIDNKEINLKKAIRVIRQEAKKGSDIVVLPEMFICPYCHASFIKYAEPDNGSTISTLAALAKELKIYIFAGSIPEIENHHIYNTCFVFNRKGEIIGRHRKMHLFDVSIQNGISFKESSVFSAGQSLTVVDTEFGPIGVAICFDIRFVEPFRLMVDRGANLIIIPAAFNMTTGPLHWELAIRSRAVDNQCFIVACSSGRDTHAKYCAWGHSSIVNPWGQIVGDLNEKEGTLQSTIDFDEVTKVRYELPILSSRRNDIYTINETGGKHFEYTD